MNVGDTQKRIEEIKASRKRSSLQRRNLPPDDTDFLLAEVDRLREEMDTRYGYIDMRQRAEEAEAERDRARALLREAEVMLPGGMAIPMIRGRIRAEIGE